MSASPKPAVFIYWDRAGDCRESICAGSLSGRCLISKTIMRALQHAHCMSTPSTCVSWDFRVACVMV